MVRPGRLGIQLEASEIEMKVTGEKIIEVFVKIECGLRLLGEALKGRTIAGMLIDEYNNAFGNSCFWRTSAAGSTRLMNDWTTFVKDPKCFHLVSHHSNSLNARLRSL
jgi:hypothetical protein